jgi:hypothetical protein
MVGISGGIRPPASDVLRDEKTPMGNGITAPATRPCTIGAVNTQYQQRRSDHEKVRGPRAWADTE